MSSNFSAMTLPPQGTVNTTTTTYNFDLTSNATEYALPLPSNTKGFTLRIRTPCPAKLAYTLNGTSGDYETVYACSTYVNNQFYSSQTIYVKADLNNVVAELLCHT